jgi:hypothetical protein
MDRAMAQAFGNRISEQPGPAASSRSGARPPVAVVLERHERLSGRYGHLFSYLGIRLARVGAGQEFAAALRAERPMAMLWELAAEPFAACRVLAAIAEHDRSLPVLMVADEDARNLAAVEAIGELWQLSEVRKLVGEPDLQEMVEFLFRASRKGGTLRMLSV